MEVRGKRKVIAAWELPPVQHPGMKVRFRLWSDDRIDLILNDTTIVSEFDHATALRIAGWLDGTDA